MCSFQLCFTASTVLSVKFMLSSVIFAIVITLCIVCILSLGYIPHGFPT